MGNLDRARQFMPFDALKGLQEALREKELEIENRKELSEESLLELDEQLKRVKIGDMVSIKCYKKQMYVEKEGIVTAIDIIGKKVVLDENELITFSDILSILPK